MKRWMLSLVLLCASQPLFSQTKVFVEAAVERRLKDIGGTFHFGIYFERKFGLNYSVGTGLKYIAYDHLDEEIEFFSSAAPEFYSVRSAYIGLPLEFNYFFSPKFQVKTFVTVLFYNESLSNPIATIEYDSEGNEALIPDETYVNSISAIDFDLGFSIHYTLSRRFKIGVGLNYAMLKREEVENTLDPEQPFEPEHVRWTLGTHFLLFRIKKNKI